MKTISKYALIVILLILTLITACGKAEPDEPDSIPQEITLSGNAIPLKLVKDKEYRFTVISRDPPALGKIDDPHHVYAYFLQNKNRNCEVIKLSTDLEVKGRYELVEGEGPGEALNPRLYGGDGDFFIVYDPPRYRYHKYDADFNYLEEYRLKTDLGVFMYSGGKYVTEHNLVLDGFSYSEDYYDSLLRIYTIQLPDNGGNRVKAVKLLYQTSKVMNRRSDDKMLLGRPIHFGYYFGHIYFLDKRSYRLMKLDHHWHVLADKKIRFTPTSMSASQRKEWVRKYHQHRKFELENFDFVDELWVVCWITRVGEGIAVGRCESYDADVKDPITADYFDKDLNYRGKITLPYFYFWNHPRQGQQVIDISHYSTDRHYYVLNTRETENDEEHWITRYRIEGAQPPL